MKKQFDSPAGIKVNVPQESLSGSTWRVERRPEWAPRVAVGRRAGPGPGRR